MLSKADSDVSGGLGVDWDCWESIFIRFLDEKSQDAAGDAGRLAAVGSESWRCGMGRDEDARKNLNLVLSGMYRFCFFYRDAHR